MADTEYTHMDERTPTSTKRSPITLWLVISVSHALLGVFLMGYNTAMFNVPADTIRKHASKTYIEDFPWEIVNAMLRKKKKKICTHFYM